MLRKGVEQIFADLRNIRSPCGLRLTKYVSARHDQYRFHGLGVFLMNFGKRDALNHIWWFLRDWRCPQVLPLPTAHHIGDLKMTVSAQHFKLENHVCSYWLTGHRGSATFQSDSGSSVFSFDQACSNHICE